MRRLLAVATLVLFLGSASVWAQRGGGHGSSGGRGGMAGRAGGGRSFGGGMRSGRGMGAGGFNRGTSFRGGSSFRRGTSFHQPSRGRGSQRFRGPRIRTFNSRNCFGCRRGFGYPFGYSGLFDPYWWWDSGSSYDESREREMALANEMNQQSLEDQRARREQDQDLYARSDPPAQAREVDRPEPPTPATVLVFRDQRKQEVRNYAIVGQTLFAFASQRTQKIPLAELDLPATAKVNDERGVDFRVPGSSEGQ